MSLLLATAVLLGSSQMKPGPWTSLFDGKSLKGWTVLMGTAKYTVVDRTIRGETMKGSPNSFLCTTRDYADFELEFEVKVHDRLNSGVQIRSRNKNAEDIKFSGEREGRYTGPQVEIEAAPGWPGYVYGEGTEFGWLSEEPKTKSPEIMNRTFFKNSAWNKYRIVAKGPRIQTFINGNAVADLSPAEIYRRFPTGSIGLQVHSIGDNEGPYDVAWKNLRIRELK